MNKEDTNLGPTWLQMIVRRFALGFVAALVGFVATQMLLFNTEKRNQVASVMADSRLWLCSHGIRVPTIGCARPNPVKAAQGSSKNRWPISSRACPSSRRLSINYGGTMAPKPMLPGY